MKSLAIVLVVACAVLWAAPAMAGWHVYGGPVVVQSFYPVGPVYAYPAPAVSYYAAPVVAPPVVVAPPMVAAPGPFLAPAPVLVGPAVRIGPRGRVRAFYW